MDIAVVGALALIVLWVRLTKPEAGRRGERAGFRLRPLRRNRRRLLTR